MRRRPWRTATTNTARGLILSKRCGRRDGCTLCDRPGADGSWCGLHWQGSTSSFTHAAPASGCCLGRVRRRGSCGASKTGSGWGLGPVRGPPRLCAAPWFVAREPLPRAVAHLEATAGRATAWRPRPALREAMDRGSPTCRRARRPVQPHSGSDEFSNLRRTTCTRERCARGGGGRAGKTNVFLLLATAGPRSAATNRHTVC